MIFSSQLGKLDGYTNEQAVKAVANHLRKVQEELEYRLSVLDSENITEIDTNITKMSGPLIELIAENEKAVAQLTIAGNEIRAEVTRELEGLHSEISQTATQLQSQFSNELLEVQSSFSQTASEIRAEVSSEIAQVQSSFSVQMNAISGVVLDLQTGQSASLKLSANGLIYNDNQGTVTINGSQIQANTVKVNSLYGSNVYFCDAYGNPAADIAVTGSSSTYQQKAVLSSGAFEVATYGGSIYLHSTLGPSLMLGRQGTSGEVYCQLTGGALLIGADSYGPLSSRPASGTYGQVYFALE